MPEKGFSSVTLRKEIVEAAKNFMNDHEKELKLQRIFYLSDLINQAVIEFMANHESGILPEEREIYAGGLRWRYLTPEGQKYVKELLSRKLQQKIISEDKKSRKMPQKT